MIYIILAFLTFSFFFFNDTATTEIYTLSLHDALPIWSRQHPDLDVAEGHAELMLLQADVPLGVTTVARVRGELARFHLGLPIRAPELVLDDLHPVEPMLDVFPIHHEAYLVPLTRGLHDPGRRGIDAVGGPGRREAGLPVCMPRVIQHLHLGPAPIDGVVVRILARAVEDPAVAAGRHVPFERQLEVLELLRCDDVCRGPHPGERTLSDPPPRRDRVHLPPPPAEGGMTVEQQLPARSALLRGQRVERRACARRAGLLRHGARRDQARPCKARPQQTHRRQVLHVVLLSLWGKSGSNATPAPRVR